MTDTNPTQIIILGGTGDLSKRKLLPALLDLYTRQMLPNDFHIIGLARSERTHAEYREFVKKVLTGHKENHHHDTAVIDDFCSRVSYVAGSFDTIDTYTELNVALNSFDITKEIHANRLFYLAVPPKYYGQIFTDLKNTDAAAEGQGSWTHILVEKPFGNNLETAKELDEQLSSLYREDQIFRIDHYLAKEAVQNILSFRFANTLLRAPWNKDSIESVHINMTEIIDVGERAGFYEGVGALRDVGQNHLLQLLALVVMRQPETFDVEAIRDERCRALNALKPIDANELEYSALRAQYTDYRTTEDIPDDSATETYFELKAELDLPEWESVPFYIRAGKALDQAEVSVTVKFKDVTMGMFETKSCQTVGNEVKLTISPEQSMAITLDAKAPGLGFQLETRSMEVACGCAEDEIKNSYEKVLFDAIAGDQVLFTRTDEVLAAWRFITPILEMWHNLPLHTYKKGTTGPDRSITPNTTN
jgi:glucose-6-phosphate 1-dehydrogenase